jgi:thiamine-phosphate pyrophosphorylase
MMPDDRTDSVFDASQQLRIFRVLDANFNRASEGLRVLEDYTRLVLDDAHLSRLCKEARHELGGCAIALPPAALSAARDTQRDVGTTLSVADERERASLNQLVVANQKRVEQSLRCLEEYTKLVEPSLSHRLEQLRYRLYTLHRAIDVTARSLAQLGQSQFCVLMDGAALEADAVRLAKWFVEAEVDLLQLRDKSLDDRTLLARARALRKVTRGTGTLLIINDRPDIAVLSDADGVHVGQDELPVADARSIVGPQCLVGVSTHSIYQARQAVLDGADYLGCGPTFPSATKAFAEFPGLDFLREVAAEIRLPAFAIGGITLERTPQVLATGVHRIAVSGALHRVPQPLDVARRFRELLRRTA